MRADVLPVVRRAKLAGRFVWLSVDAENGANAPFLERFPTVAMPTFLVVDPRDESVIVKFLGGADAARLERLLAVAERRSRGRGRGGDADAILARADRAYGAGRVDEAIADYRRALARGGAAWGSRSSAVESLVLALSVADRGAPRGDAPGGLEDCAGTAAREAPSLPRGGSFANAVGVGLGCAVEAPAAASWRPRAIDALLPLAEEAVKLPGLIADDRSGLWEAIAGAREERGDVQGAHEAALAWWSFLESARSQARSAEARSALDSHAVAAALALGDPGRAVPLLAESARALPRDYNPRARLATLYRELGRLADARAESDAALARAYGPRKLKVYLLAAGIEEKAGDRAAAAAKLAEGVAYARTLPASQRDEDVERKLEARLAEARR
jgi:tetratricopeptide (TPR) repeat protein